MTLTLVYFEGSGFFAQREKQQGAMSQEVQWPHVHSIFCNTFSAYRDCFTSQPSGAVQGQNEQNQNMIIEISEHIPEVISLGMWPQLTSSFRTAGSLISPWPDPGPEHGGWSDSGLPSTHSGPPILTCTAHSHSAGQLPL